MLNQTDVSAPTLNILMILNVETLLKMDYNEDRQVTLSFQ